MTKPKLYKSRPPEPLVGTIFDATFKWPSTGTYPTCSSFQLSINELSIQKNQVVGITGCTGAGKTNLLLSLLGHTQLIRGVVRLKSTVAFFPKEPVIIAGSLKDNILMGAEYNPKRFGCKCLFFLYSVDFFYALTSGITMQFALSD
jgi:ATP-binding cassette, subfamily C (CFTR/MRP), member 10